MENNIDHVKHIAEIIKSYGYKFEDTRAHYYLNNEDNPEQECIKTLIIIPEQLITTKEEYESNMQKESYLEGYQEGLEKGRDEIRKEVFNSYYDKFS